MRRESETRSDTAAPFTSIVKRMMLIAAASLAITGTAAGQQPVSATVGVTAEIIQSLSVQGTSDLNFGQIVTTGSAAIKAIDKTSPDAGRFEIVGSGNEQVQVAYRAPGSLNRISGSGTIGVNLQMFGATSAGKVSGAEEILQNQTVTLSGGRYYFFIGGSLEVGPTSQNPPGIYSGEFELEVSYTSL